MQLWFISHWQCRWVTLLDWELVNKDLSSHSNCFGNGSLIHFAVPFRLNDFPVGSVGYLFQDLVNHDPCAGERGLAMTNGRINHDILAEFFSH